MAAPMGAEYIISTPAQFWGELEETLSLPNKASLEQMDLALKTFVYFGARYYHEYLSHERELDTAVQMLLESRFYDSNSDRMLNLIMDLVEARKPGDSTPELHVLLHILLQNGKQRPHVFKLLRQPRLSPTRAQGRPFLQLLLGILYRTEEEAHATGEQSTVEGIVGLETTDLLYEILRVKRLAKDEIALFEERIIIHLFEIVEQTRTDRDETYNYTLMRLIIALNEQFMVAGIDGNGTSSRGPGHDKHAKKSTSSDSPNLVLKILNSKHGDSKTFGENLIFILNRLNSSSGHASAEDLCVSLLVLKILYLLFSTASTSEYFYTNDLRVLVDIFIRELLDLPEESEGLRHTYLRVLHPLMTHTQLRTYPYKRPEIRATLLSLLSDEHIRHVSPTTRRLVERNLKADWCTALAPAPKDEKEVEAEAQVAKEMSTLVLQKPVLELFTHDASDNDALSPRSATSATHSTLSVNEVADAEHPHVRKSASSLSLRKRAASRSIGSGASDIRMAHSEEPPLQTRSPDSLQVPFEYEPMRDRSAPNSRSGTDEHANTAEHPLASSVDSLTSPKTGKRVPPPRPPRTGHSHASSSRASSQSLPNTPPDSSVEESTGSTMRTRVRRAPPPTPSRSRKEELQASGIV